MSDNWLPIAQGLKDHYKIYLPDLRNHGLSQHTDTHTYEDISGDVNLFFDEHHLERGILLGHSMGGKAAMKFALQNPEKISALIIADIAPINYGQQSVSKQVLRHGSIVEAMQNLPLQHFKTRLEAEVALNTLVNDSKTTRFLLKNMVREKSGFRWRLNLPVLQQFLSEISGGFNPLDYNPSTSFPVLFLKGSESDYITPEGEKAIRRLFPFSKIETIDNAGHWLHAEQPEKFVKTVMGFLN
jgi:pimeloyl-ACP methyl ester carboxylesterase